MAIPWWLTVMLAASAFLASAPNARAEPGQPRRDSHMERSIVELFVVGSDAGFAEMLAVLDAPPFAAFELRWERLERFDSAMLFGRGTLEAGVHCFIDLSDPKRARLYFSDRPAEHFLVRTLPFANHGSAADRKELSEVVTASLGALLEHRPGNLTRDEVHALLPGSEPSEPSEPSPPDRPALVREPQPFPLRPGAFYAVSAHSSHIPVTHGPGVALAMVDFGSRRRGTLQLSAAYEFPQNYLDSRFDLDLSSLVLRAGVEVSGALGAEGPGGFYLGGRLGAGADLTRLSPQGSTGQPTYEPHPGKLSKSFVLTAAVLGSLRLAPERSVFAELSADVDPFEVHYDVLSDHVETVIERFRVRPGASVGVRMW
jgi:hypothetical protein